MRLSTVLILCVIAPLALVFAAVGWIGLRAVERQAEARKQEDIQLIARAIRMPLSHSLEHERIGAVREALHSAFAVGRVYGARVFDHSGALLVGAGAGADAIGERRLADVADNGDRVGIFERVGGEELYSYFVPLTDSGGRIAGILQVTRRGAEFEEDLRRIRVWGVALIVALGAVVAGVVLIGHRWAIGNPISSMVASMRRVEAGERELRTPPTGPGELSALAVGFNSMLESIEGSEREIEARREQQRSLEAELRHSQKLAAIGALATGVAHELGAPLSVIDGKAQRLLRRHPQAPDVRGALETIRAEVARMGRIVRQMMDFGRRNPIARTPGSLRQLVTLAVSGLDASRDVPAVRFEVVGDGASPVLHSDRHRLLQALDNLLRNAAQAAGDGGHVRIGWASRAGELSLYVDDDGPGVPEPIRDRLFEPFFTTKSVGSGTGLGLAVVHGAVADHGGRIVVERSPELGGARFRIVLPVSAAGPA